MSIDSATLQGLSIPEGNVIEIKDAAGRVIWDAVKKKPAILTVEKQVNTTYAGETAYENEEFILLDIYPETNRTVKVTYGGLTKTVTDTSGAEEPNAQQVFFGTFNGVSDSVTTPVSGELKIEGAYRGYGLGAFSNASGKYANTYPPNITSIVEFGEPAFVPGRAFYACTKITSISLPNSVKSILPYAFWGCTALNSVAFSEGLQTIGQYAFGNCFISYNSTKSFTLTLPEGLQTIGPYAFHSNINDFVQFEEVTLPSTIISIGELTFALTHPSPYQSNVRNLIVLATVPPTKDGSASYGILGSKTNLAAIYVPKGCGDAYKASDGWKSYADYIVEAS